MQNIIDLEQEIKFHSIVVMRTNQEELANKFKHTIFTRNDSLVYAPTKDETGFDYNLELDAFKCSWHHAQPLVLANFEAIRTIFDQTTLTKLDSSIGIHFHQLGQFQLLEFYIYLEDSSFLKIYPFVVIHKTIVFTFHQNDEKTLKMDQFREIASSNPDSSSPRDECFCFSSEFGLLSDHHFMNNFVRGYREYSYYKKHENAFIHAIDSQLIRRLNALFPMSKI